MIARLHGRVAALELDAVIVDVGGVGYRVHVPVPLLSELGPEGASVTLYTHMHVRETEITLFGATDEATLALFGLLLGVSGVGPRLALATVSTFDAATLEQAIVGEDVELLTQVSGVGRKSAQRIVLDLKGRLEKLGVVPGPLGAAMVAGVDQDAVAALTALGYSTGEARRALAAVTAADDVAPDADVEDRIVAALRVLARA